MTKKRREGKRIEGKGRGGKRNGAARPLILLPHDW
jgi:hypothetical protein